MTAASTDTRADDLRLWTELDALSVVLTNILDSSGLNPAGVGGGPFQVASWDWPGIEAKMLQGPSFLEINDRLWDSSTEYEETADYKRASVRGTLLAASVFTWLASDEGREACSGWALRLLDSASRELADAEGGN